MSRILTLVACAAASSIGCAPAVVVRPAPHAAASPSSEPAPLAVDVRVTRPDGAVLLAGRLDVDRHHAAVLEHHEPHAPDASLEIDARARPDGTYLLAVSWKDASEDGRRVVWRPSVVVARGADAHARIAWEGGGRELAISAR